MKTIYVNSWNDVPKNFTGKIFFKHDAVGFLRNGKLHCENGPAMVVLGRINFYYINGIQVIREAQELYSNLLKLKGMKIK